MIFGLAVAIVGLTSDRTMEAAPGWMPSIRSQLPVLCRARESTNVCARRDARAPAA